MDREHRFPIWVRLLLVLSGTAYTALLMQTTSKWSFLITAVTACLLLGLFLLRWGLGEKLFAPQPLGVTLTAGALSLSAVYTAKSSFFVNCWTWMYRLVTLLGVTEWETAERALRLIPWGVALAAAPMAFGYFLWFTGLMWRLAQRLWRSSDFTERMFVLSAGILFAMMIGLSYICTQAFYGAHINGHWYNFDLIYAADSGYLVHQDVYRNVGAEQNDLRQPLFGVFAMPFAQGAWLLSRLLWFLPGDSYVILWQIVQMLLFLIALVLLSRMMGLSGAEKALFLLMLCVLWPTMVFVLTAEQYLLAVFYLVLLLYLSREPVSGELFFCAATGSLLTSGVWFPLVTWDRDLKTFWRRTWRLCGGFFALTTLFGRLTTFLDLPGYILRYGYYAGGDIPAREKLLQFVNFAGACLLAPPSGPDEASGHISWQMLPVTDWSGVGLLVLGLALAGLLLDRRDRFSRQCGGWILFSFLLLGVVGWGAVDNGMMLYTLYFMWAFAALTFRLLDRALARVRPVKLTVLLLLILAICVWNINGLRDMMIFATQFYPALGGIG